MASNPGRRYAEKIRGLLDSEQARLGFRLLSDGWGAAADALSVGL